MRFLLDHLSRFILSIFTQAGVIAIYRLVRNYIYVLSAVAEDCPACDALYGARLFVENDPSGGTRLTHIYGV